MANFKDGVIRNGSSPGSGSPVGNVKNGVIRKGGSGSAGGGTAVGNVKNGYVYKGGSGSAGGGSKIGRVKDYSMRGSDYMDEATAVACYHFLIKNIF